MELHVKAFVVVPCAVRRFLEEGFALKGEVEALVNRSTTSP